MLVLTQREGEEVELTTDAGERIVIRIGKMRRNRAVVTYRAPKSVRIYHRRKQPAPKIEGDQGDMG